MLDWLKSLFGRSGSPQADTAPARFTIDDLAARIGVQVSNLRIARTSYRTFNLPKRSGGTRTISSPNDELKRVQRQILRRLLRRLRAHPCAMGFERGRSIADNARLHVNADVVIRMDLKDFFGSTSADRVFAYFRFIGYDAESAELLTRLCTHNGSLPQGAPTSPRLSNLMNYRLDARLAFLAARRGMTYTRYADDITFSFHEEKAAAAVRQYPKTLERYCNKAPRPNDIIVAAKTIIEDEGYRLHMRKKLRIARRHQRQLVTGLVVNHTPNLPRATRRRLRAIEHHLRTGRNATLTEQQLDGWKALRRMISAMRNVE